MKRMLVIDDSAEIGALVSFIVKPLAYACEHATTFAQFKTLLRDDVSVIVVDMLMPDVDGIEVLRYLGEQQCRAGILLYSRADRRILSVAEEMARAMQLRVLGLLDKPIVRGELAAFLRDEENIAAPEAVRADVPTLTADELRRAIAGHQLVMHYQPQIDLRTGAATGVEALVRWQHPQHGLLFPDAFIPLSETHKLIDDLTWEVTDQVLADSRLFAAGHWHPTLSINVSAMSLHDLKLPDRLFERATAPGLPPTVIVVEITESGLINNVSVALDILTRLRLRGFGLSIDDFGTGFSMMQQLRHIPATELKIDKEFIRVMAHQRDAAVIVRKTIEIGHELGMKVVAEGVENIAQRRTLSALDCDLAQGYLFARPMPAQAVVAWHKANTLALADMPLP